MALEVAFQELHRQLYALHEALVSLRTTTREDKPVADDAVLVDLFGDAADDLLGWLEGARQAAGEAQQAVSYPADLQRTWRALAVCQGRFQQINQRFTCDLIGYDRVAELIRFGRRRGGEWQVWAASVKAALTDCQTPLFTVGDALFTCWQEVAERTGGATTTIQAINVGQKLSIPHYKT